jgi:hypothetical protein
MNTNDGVALYNLKIKQGADYRLPIQFKTYPAGTAINKTGYTYSAKLNQYIDGAVANTINIPVAVTDLTQGQIYLNLVNTTTATITYTLAKWDLFETQTSSGLIKKVMCGDVFISLRVAR